jgi:hypothetical protein
VLAEDHAVVRRGLPMFCAQQPVRMAPASGAWRAVESCRLSGRHRCQPPDLSMQRQLPPATLTSRNWFGARLQASAEQRICSSR